MIHRLSRLAIAGLLAAAASVYADDLKCNVAVRECDQQIRNMLGGKRFHGAQIEEKKGLVVKSITEKSPAERAGLRVGDRLIAINGKSLTNASTRDFKQLVADARNTGRVGLIIWRQGGYRKLDIRLEPYSKEQMDKIIAGHLATHAHPAGSN